MQTLILLGIFFVAVLLSSGAASLLDPFLPFSFMRIFNRCFLLFGLTGAYFFRTRFQKKPLASLGLAKEEHTLSLIVKGVVFALLSLLVLTLLSRLCQTVVFEYHPPKLKKLFYYVSGAILIAFFEELFFRGFLLQTLMEDLPTRPSVILSSMIYSLAHFIRPLVLNEPNELSLFYTESVGLFLFGILMSYAFLRTRSLYLPMGLHGGFVFFLKMDGIFVNRPMVTPEWLFGGERLVGGIVTWLIFAVAFPWVKRVGRRYLPMQNCEKILSSKSSVNTSPTISPKA